MNIKWFVKFLHVFCEVYWSSLSFFNCFFICFMNYLWSLCNILFKWCCNEIHTFVKVFGCNSPNASSTAVMNFVIFLSIFLCINDCMLLKKPNSRMLQSGLFEGCWVRMNVNLPCLLCCYQIGSSFVIWTLALSCWIKISERPSLGHLLSMARLSCCISIFLYTSWVTDSVGFISITPLVDFFSPFVLPPY